MDKIIQIIPAPSGILLWFDTGREYGQRRFARPALCMALTEDEHGDRDVVFLFSDSSGDILSTGDALVNFVGVFPYSNSSMQYPNM